MRMAKVRYNNSKKEYSFICDLKNVNLTEKQVVVLKSLLVNELEDLKDEIVTAELEQDKKALQEELEACKDLLEQLNK